MSVPCRVLVRTSASVTVRECACADTQVHARSQGLALVGLERPPSPRSHVILRDAQTSHTTQVVRPWVDPPVLLTVNRECAEPVLGSPVLPSTPGQGDLPGRWPQAMASLLPLVPGATQGPGFLAPFLQTLDLPGLGDGQREALPGPSQPVSIPYGGGVCKREVHADVSRGCSTQGPHCA